MSHIEFNEEEKNGIEKEHEKKPHKEPKEGTELTGKIKWFNLEKWYGFIEVEGMHDVFLDLRGIGADNPIRPEDIKNIKVGDKVTFIYSIGAKGPTALKARIIK